MHCNKDGCAVQDRTRQSDQSELTAEIEGVLIMLVVNTLAKRLRRWASYRNTVRELSQLTDRDLHDLGINRGEIRHVAKKHAKA